MVPDPSPNATHRLLTRAQEMMVIPMVACGLLTASLAAARLSGVMSWEWRWIVAPALIALALWLVVALATIVLMWFIVRVGKDIP